MVTEKPSLDDLDAAREAWLAARDRYGREDERTQQLRAEYRRIFYARNPHLRPEGDES